MAWYDSSWLKRKKITLTGGTSGAQTDYQVKLTVTYDSDMQTDFDDLRFTKTDGTTLIDAWLESKTDSNSAVVWVKTDTPADTIDADIYMYYGNSAASSAWNGVNTFLAYHGVATATFTDSEIISGDVVYEAKVKVTGTSDDIQWGMKNSGGANHIIRSRSSKNARYGYGYDEIGGSYQSNTPKLPQNIWVRLLIEMKSVRTNHYVDGNQFSSGIAGHFPSNNVGLSMTESWGGGEQEWSFAHKYAANPATYAFGSEEGGGDEGVGVVTIILPHLYNLLRG